MSRWMIYGAYGYTGRLVIEEAVARGHSPVLAGRNAAKVESLAEQHGLEARPFALDDASIDAHLHDVDLVLHCAGPFIHTAEPMVDACIRTRTHYLDITGEWPVMERNFALRQKAEAAGIVLLSGVGFDVVPSDCLAAHVAAKLPDAVSLDIGISAIGGPDGASGGTLASTVEALPSGAFARRDGVIQPVTYFGATRDVRFSSGKTMQTLRIPWGDIATAYHSTGIPNITTWFVYPRWMARFMATVGEGMVRLMRVGALRKRVVQRIQSRVDGPSAHTRATGRCYLWAQATNANGESAQAWLETAEGYEFTKIAAVRSVERVLDSELSGPHTPATAFSADFVLEIPGTQRFDSL